MSLSPIRGNAKWINNQWVPNAVIEAEQIAEAKAEKAKQHEWDSSWVARLMRGAFRTAMFAFGAVLFAIGIITLCFCWHGFIGALIGISFGFVGAIICFTSVFAVWK